MKHVFSVLTFLSILAMTSVATAREDSQVGRPVSEAYALIECAVSTVHLCNQKSCESVPVFFTPEDKYPLKINLKTQEVISLYDKGEEHRSLVLEVRNKSDKLEVLGRAEKSSFGGQPMSWLMQIYYESGDMIMSGAGKGKGVIIFGSCNLGEAGHVAQ